MVTDLDGRTDIGWNGSLSCRYRLALAGLEGANLRDADLEGANLAMARLAGTDLSGARMQGSDMRGAVVWRALAPMGGEVPALADMGQIVIQQPPEEDWAALAAALLQAAAPGALDHCLVAHCSAEPGHRRLVERLGKKPLLDLGMRLGEASGAALAIPVLRAAIACHNGMASFAEAGVSDKSE